MHYAFKLRFAEKILFCAYFNMYSSRDLTNFQNLATCNLAIFEVTHPHTGPSDQDSPAVGLVCGARPLAEVIPIKIFTIPSHFDVSTEDNMHILVGLPVHNHVENPSHFLVEPVSVYQICAQAEKGGKVPHVPLRVFSLFWFGVGFQHWLIYFLWVHDWNRFLQTHQGRSINFQQLHLRKLFFEDFDLGL